MKPDVLIGHLRESTSEFEELEWLQEAIVFGPAIEEDPVDSDVDLLLLAARSISSEEKRAATVYLRETLEARVRQPVALRITTSFAADTARSRGVGHGRILEGRTVTVYRRST